MTRRVGVAVIPVSAFYHGRHDDRVVRFCFARRAETLRSRRRAPASPAQIAANGSLRRLTLPERPPIIEVQLTGVIPKGFKTMSMLAEFQEFAVRATPSIWRWASSSVAPSADRRFHRRRPHHAVVGAPMIGSLDFPTCFTSSARIQQPDRLADLRRPAFPVFAYGILIHPGELRLLAFIIFVMVKQIRPPAAQEEPAAARPNRRRRRKTSSSCGNPRCLEAIVPGREPTKSRGNAAFPSRPAGRGQQTQPFSQPRDLPVK